MKMDVPKCLLDASDIVLSPLYICAVSNWPYQEYVGTVC